MVARDRASRRRPRPGRRRVTAPQRVLYLSPTAQLGGAEQSLLDLAGALDRRRYAPHLLCLDDGPLLAAAAARQVMAAGITVPAAFARTSLRGRRTPLPGLIGAMLRALPVLAAVRRASRRPPAAVVHSNGNKTHVLSLPLARARTPVVWHVRDFLPDRRPERLLLRLAGARVAAIVANSAAVAAHLVALGVPPERVHAIPNGIDLARFRPDGPRADLRATFGWSRDTRLVGMVGVLARWKGQEVFLRAAREVASRLGDVRFVVIGAELYRTRGHGDLEAELRARARVLELDGVLAFAGHRDDVPEVLRDLDVVVHASIDPEPFGRVIAEAMACARPIVWARGGGADEIVGDTPLAALGVPRADAGALASAITRALTDARTVGAWAREGPGRITAHFSLERHVRDVQALYAALTARRP